MKNVVVVDQWMHETHPKSRPDGDGGGGDMMHPAVELTDKSMHFYATWISWKGRFLWENWHLWGGAVETQLLEIIYFWKFDTKFSFKSIEFDVWNALFNQQAQK